MTDSQDDCRIIKAKTERKTFKFAVNKISDEILNNESLKHLSKRLPSNYNFEIPKTIWSIRKLNAKRVALQMPEGLLKFATTIADIIEVMTGADSIIMGDVTYGACCVDDFTAKALAVDLLVHYGHNCIVPPYTARVKVLYVFVDIQIDPKHFIEIIKCNFNPEKKLAFVSTIQFSLTLKEAVEKLKLSGFSVNIPRIEPLSSGELLGCTAPFVKNVDALIYLGDERFHLEAAMIANPKLEAFRYDPYEKKFIQEYYNHEDMKQSRINAVELSKGKKVYGLILGSLGRQGNLNILKYLQGEISKMGKESVVVLLSEIFPHVLNLMLHVDVWLQIACPRLSIDWGGAFSKPLLTPYEFSLIIEKKSPEWSKSNDEAYPMDFYAINSKGPWTPNHHLK